MSLWYLMCVCTLLCAAPVAAVVKTIPSTSVRVFSSSQGANVAGSFSQCCSYEAPSQYSSTLTQSVSPLTTAWLNLTAGCNSFACECYTAGQTQTTVDITPLYEQCKGGSVTIFCGFYGGCEYSAVNISYLRVQQGVNNNGYWPWPYNQACNNNTSTSYCTNFTYLHEYSARCADPAESCSVTLPLVDPSLTGGALLISMYAFPDCGGMNCGGSNSYANTCQFTSMACP